MERHHRVALPVLLGVGVHNGERAVERCTGVDVPDVDTIAHNKLMKAVAERIADKSILALLNHWLKGLVIQVSGRRQTVIGGGRDKRYGTPQGGVISPLLANVYLNILDRIWERHELDRKYRAKLIRYADDMVILCQGEADRAYSVLRTILGKLELSLNEDKTQIRDARKEAFKFLGFDIGIVSGRRSKKYFPLIEPSCKAMESVKQKIKFYTRREMNPIPMEGIVGKLNEVVRGWSRSS